MKPFIQTVDEKSSMTLVLLQRHGDKLRLVAYFSSKLDPQCLRAVAAAEKARNASGDIVGYAPLTLLVPQAVSMILLEQKTLHLSAQLDIPNVEVKCCNTLNPAPLLPLPDDSELRCHSRHDLYAQT